MKVLKVTLELLKFSDMNQEQIDRFKREISAREVGAIETVTGFYMSQDDAEEDGLIEFVETGKQPLEE